MKYRNDTLSISTSAFSISQNSIGDCGVGTLAKSLEHLPRLHCLRYKLRF